MRCAPASLEKDRRFTAKNLRKRQYFQLELKLFACHLIPPELSQIPMLEKKFMVKKLVELSKETIELNERVTKKAKNIETFGIKSYDALHLAAAISGKCDCFISTDDRLLKKAKKNIKGIIVFNPLEFYIYEALN
jgi:predicted nucleic acid-binding protein